MMLRHKLFTKHTLMAGAVCTLILCCAGCNPYQAPLQEKSNITLDEKLLQHGVWESLRAEGSQDDPVHLNILKFSESDYLIQYSGEAHGKKFAMFYRGYPIKVAGVDCVQIKLIGTHEGPPGMKEDKELGYDVIAYEIKDGVLEIKQLNPEVVSSDLATTKQLQEAFTANQSHKGLFKNVQRFNKH